MPRHSAAVYRRRRLAVLSLLLVLILAIGGGVWLALAQPWNAPAPSASSPAPEAEPTASSPSPSPTSPAPSASPEPSASAELVACTAKHVSVEAVTDAETYPADALPQLSIRLTNISDTDCAINVGSATQTFEISSGSDVWWRSTDCQQNPSDMIVTLAAGQSVTSSEPVVWDRTRSSVDTCDEPNRPRAPGGGASYHVSVSIGGFESITSRQFLLY
ncbi:MULTISPECIES: hypothetical protein [Microbacterium]|uniref:hypothetical protein n=1 Tax=Microbacterium TaxID=33882 RepID=UPI00217E6382|nr:MULTISPECIES: hypothetical protein [Microbacterium]UWF77276.1 hypothetical protein JSY13_10910 [Microbacterium neungamense]WCM55433.1 hypothetical protein JRG78_10905 [Microbacterium sp. EF45047]